jgi:unsaturated rhamnogalacturonyl hydrolase
MMRGMNMTLAFRMTVIGLMSCSLSLAGEKPWSARMADSAMTRNPDPLMIDSHAGASWNYTQGVILDAILDVWIRTGDERYRNYVKAFYDGSIDADGRIKLFVIEEYNIDRINAGKPLFVLFEKTGEEKYKRALQSLRQQFRGHPRTSEGGLWHKQRYPSQMWLDGLYMGATFLAEYGKVMGEPEVFDDVVLQFVLMEKHARDEKTGLLYHGWDESRIQKWCDPKTGLSRILWARGVGWYAMALVDTLDFLPADHPRRGELIAILNRLAPAIARYQDPKSGVWYQVLDQGGRKGNYLESSASCMFSYTLLKAARLGYIDAKYAQFGKRAYEGILKEFIEADKSGEVHIHRGCQGAGLGPDPANNRYRDGSYEYYLSEKVRSNDTKSIGSFIVASLEFERL